MRAVSAVSALDVAAATSFIAVDRSCPDPSTGCNGGCYQWEDDVNFYGNCMHGKSPAADIIIPDPVIVIWGGLRRVGIHALDAGPVRNTHSRWKLRA